MLPRFGTPEYRTPRVRGLAESPAGHTGDVRLPPGNTASGSFWGEPGPSVSVPSRPSWNERKTPDSSDPKTSRPPGAISTCVGEDFGGTEMVEPVRFNDPSSAIRNVV